LLELKKAVETEYNFVLTDTSFYKGFEKSIGKININELTNLTHILMKPKIKSWEKLLEKLE